MKGRYRVILTLAAVLIAAGLWTWRFLAVNRHYHALAGGDGAEDTVYGIGDTVEYGGAFSIRVDSFEILDNGDLDAAPEHLSALQLEDRTAIVRITVTKNDGSDTAFPISDFTVHGSDFRLATYWDILFDLNPGIKRDASRVLMREGESRTFVLPFPIARSLLTSRWDRLDSLPLYLIVSSHEDIRLQ